ncbi:Rv3654c family TadE-like protein [Nonomuraea sp. NPDC049141]|uniref:Rv3654c family TadE-like protein n=1 Tax=Nonomuraea sp. NPDC049141 TaxID=3155500 RepID=UPI0033FE1078
MTYWHTCAKKHRESTFAKQADRGSASLWGVALMGLLMTVAMAFVTVGSVRVARHHVQDAADLSALAAARLAIVDPQAACDRAKIIAAKNAVQLLQCTLTGEIADVRTSLTITLPAIGTRTLTGRARAGPSEYTDQARHPWTGTHGPEQGRRAGEHDRSRNANRISMHRVEYE